MGLFDKKPKWTPDPEVDRRTEKLVARLETMTELVEETAESTKESADRLDDALTRLEDLIAADAAEENGNA